ncbi:unnamed protein product [Caenorhabditis brenneri]
MPCRLPFFSPFHSLRIKKYKMSPPPPPPKGFPLLKLPHFPLKYVINQLELVDVLELTMLFSRFKRAVQTARIEVGLLHLQFGVYYDMIRIPTNSYLFHSGCMSFEPSFQKDEMKTEWKVGKLNGEVVPICRTTDGGGRFNVIKVMTESDNGMKDKLKVMERITMHLHTILNVKEVTVQCYRKWEFEDLFLWQLYSKIRRIQVQPTSAVQRIDKSWTQSFDDILGNASCKNLEFKFSEYPAVGINKLFKEWISGKGPDLEELHFFVATKETPKWNEQCLHGITTVESFCKVDERNVCERLFTVLRSPQVDIKRATDGRLATVTFEYHGVSLYVWHEKHLNDPKFVRGLKYTRIYM